MNTETIEHITLPGAPLKREPTDLLRPVRVDFSVKRAPFPKDFFITRHSPMPDKRGTFYSAYESNGRSQQPCFADIIQYDPIMILELTLRKLSSLQQIDQRTTELSSHTERTLKGFNTKTRVYTSDEHGKSGDYWAFKLLNVVLSDPDIPTHVKQCYFEAYGKLLGPLFMGVETVVLQDIARTVVPKLKRIIFRFRVNKKSDLHRAIIFHEYEHLEHRLGIYPGANFHQLSDFCERILQVLVAELASTDAPGFKSQISAIQVELKRVVQNIWAHNAYGELAAMLIESRLSDDPKATVINQDAVIWRLANYISDSNTVTYEALELFVQGDLLASENLAHQNGATMLYLQQDILGTMAFDPKTLANRLLLIAHDPNQLFNSVAEWEALYQVAYDRLRETFAEIQLAASKLMTAISRTPLKNTYHFDLKTLEAVSLTDRRPMHKPRLVIQQRSIE